jgi:hypothetical protein
MVDGATISVTGPAAERTKGLPESMRPQPGVSRADDGGDNDGIAACLDHEQYWDMPEATKGG